MKLFFRLFWLIITQSMRSRVGLLGPCTTTLRVFPNDLDAFFHVNNGVYLTYADLGRIDLMLRSNVFRKLRRKNWFPVAAAASIQYKKSLLLWQQFDIRTEVLGWDERAIYLQQDFIQHNQKIATLLIDARFLSKETGKVTPLEFCTFLGIDPQSPPLPEHLKLWINSTKQWQISN